MKIIKLIGIVFTMNMSITAQQMEGVVKYKTTGNWIKTVKPLNYLSKQQKEKLEYQWGNDAEWKQYNLLYFNEKESKYIESEEKAEYEGGYAGKKEKYEIHKNYANNTQKDIIEIFGKVHIIDDSLHTMDWKIKNDIKEIANHICMNAVREDTVKIQKFTAWFALDIPIPTGPERSHGLPGMILELDINDGALNIVAESITMKKLTNELDFSNKIKGKKITEAQYKEIINKHMAEKIKEEEYPYYGIPY